MSYLWTHSDGKNYWTII